MQQPSLLCVDGPWLLYRSFFALPAKIPGTAGQPVNALLGAVNALVELVRERQPRAVVVCFGAEAAEYRVEGYSGYHADRPPMPAALARQWEQAGDLFAACGWYVRDHGSLEADDLLHSYALVESAAGGSTLIFTADRDMFQCVTEQVHVLMPRRGQRELDEIGPDAVVERYGITPEVVPDFIALRGDPSDGLPGAKGIGAKTASELLTRYGSLEGVIAGAIGQRPGVRRALLGQAQELLMYKDIATLRVVKVARPSDQPTRWKSGASAARELGMNALAGRLDSMI